MHQDEIFPGNYNRPAPGGSVKYHAEPKQSQAFWLRGFISYTHWTGLKGKEGSRAPLKFKMGVRGIEMTETVLKIVSPKKIYITY